jgi:hypothetical protein
MMVRKAGNANASSSATNISSAIAGQPHPGYPAHHRIINVRKKAAKMLIAANATRATAAANLRKSRRNFVRPIFCSYINGLLAERGDSNPQ